MKAARWLAAAVPFFLCGSLYSGDVSVSFSGGLFFPKEKIYRDIYGRSLPLNLEFRIGLSRFLGIAAGAEYLSDHGSAFNINQGEDEYPVRLRMTSFPVSICLIYHFSRVSAFFGSGFSFHNYEEKWESAALTHKGRTASLIAYSGAEFRLFSRVSARLALRYESVEAETASVLSTGVNLGGLSLFGGFSFRLF